MRSTVIITEVGNSSKPISVYAQGRSDNCLLSSAGLKFNISSFTLNISLGVDDIGIKGSIKDGAKINAFGLKADLSQQKIGFEWSKTAQWDNHKSITNYTNVGIDIFFLIAGVYAVRGGAGSNYSPEGAPSWQPIPIH